MSTHRHVCALGLVLLAAGAVPSRGVTSRVHRQGTFKELSPGHTENVLVESRGTLRLGRSAEVLADDLPGVWSINSVTCLGGAVYFGTSPNGGVYRYQLGQLERLYPPPSDADANGLGVTTHEHVFATCADLAGRLVAAFSGADCRVMRFGTGGWETLLRPDDAQYVFALTTDAAGRLLVGTGPAGHIDRVDALSGAVTRLHSLRDDNVLSLATDGAGGLYAGSDTRGLILRLQADRSRAEVLYDSPQPEVTALLWRAATETGPACLYALGTSAKLAQAPPTLATRLPLPGRPEAKETAGDKEPSPTAAARRFQIAGQPARASEGEAKDATPPRRPRGPETASTLWRVDPQGYVTAVARQRAVFFCLARWHDRLLIGTGNSGRLLRVDPDTEDLAVLYEDPRAEQITAVAVAQGVVTLGTANPARLVRLSERYAPEGTYTSDLIDAGQPARWGRLQLDADLPAGCRIRVSSRSGNVGDANDPSFSPWTEPVLLDGPVPLTCPRGRYAQYRLHLDSPEGRATPVIREVAVASSVPNLAPVVTSVDVLRSRKGSRGGTLLIRYEARDDNDDPLTYTLSFRRQGRTGWIRLKGDLRDSEWSWDGRTVEDGRYEVRVQASDAAGNSPATARTGARVSEPVLVDNTGPVVAEHRVRAGVDGATLDLVIRDAWSAVAHLDYTVDSHERWQGTVPEDLVYDTSEERFELVIEDLTPGPHVVGLRIRDDLGNTTYRSFEVTVGS